MRRKEADTHLTHAYFLQAFRNIGLVPDGGATYLLPRKVGWSRAMELSLLGEKLPASKALEFGICNYVYPHQQLMNEALKVARKLATGPTTTLAMIRTLMWESFNHTYEQQMAMEAKMQKKAFDTNDCQNAMKAFAKKLPRPVFQGE